MIKKLAFRVLMGFWPNNDDLNRFVSIKHDMIFYIEKAGFDKAVSLLQTADAASFEIFRTRDRHEWVDFLQKRSPKLIENKSIDLSSIQKANKRMANKFNELINHSERFK